MSQREILSITTGRPTSDGAGVSLTRVFGGAAPERFDPFLMLDEFGSNDPDEYIAGFPPHPHRGFETITYMLEGRMRHEDHMGNVGRLESGGVQWMTAGSGLVHSEMPEQEAGRMRGFQLWINLPAKDKMTAPKYQEFAPDGLPVVAPAAGVSVKLIAGTVDGVSGPIAQPATDPVYLDITLQAGTAWSYRLPDGHNAFAYVYEGGLDVGEGEDARPLAQQELAVLGGGARLQLQAGVSPALVYIIQGVILLAVVIAYELTRRAEVRMEQTRVARQLAAGLVLVLAVGAIGILVAGRGISPRRRVVDDAVPVGGSARVMLEMQDRPWITVVPLGRGVVREHLPEELGGQGDLPLARRMPHVLHVSRRGGHALGPYSILVRDVFGLFHLRRTVEDGLRTIEVLGAGEKGRYITALTFGNVHGVYKPGNVKLTPSILLDIQKAVGAEYGQDMPFDLVMHGGSGSTLEEIQEAVDNGVIKMNIDTDTQYAFTRPVVSHMFENYSGVLKVDGEVGNKKQYDPRAWGKEADAYAGRRLTLYRDPDVTFGRDKVGGINVGNVACGDTGILVVTQC